MSYVSLSKVFFLSLVIPLTALAHNTTHIHPMITDRVASLIAQEDGKDSSAKKYEEIYKVVEGARLYWGKDQDVDKTLDVGRLKEDQLEEYTNYTNVMNGVVQEDAPVSKVLSHFYHANTGIELRLNGSSAGGIPSANRAMFFFKNAIEFYGGYTEQAKQRAYFTFGQSLHHVEDMSSPAHIHNDAHLSGFFNGAMVINSATRQGVLS